MRRMRERVSRGGWLPSGGRLLVRSWTNRDVGELLTRPLLFGWWDGGKGHSSILCA